MTAPVFDGATYQAEHDQLRLTGQLKRVHQLLGYLYGDETGWWTLDELAQAMPGASPASISARIRDLRKPQFGGHEVERRRRGDPSAGLWEYRLGAPGTYRAPGSREPTGAELPMPVTTWLQNHPQAATCPGCGDDLRAVGITRLVYAFDACECGQVPYAHLVEQLWHSVCFREAE